MQVTVVEEFNHDEWDVRLKKASGGPFLSVPWLESFRDSKCSPFYFRFVSETNTVGLAAGLRFSPPHPLLGKIFKKLFLFTGPVFMQSIPDLKKLCLTKLYEYAVKENYTHLEIRAYDYSHPLGFGKLPFIKEKKEEYILDLQRDWPEIERNMRKNIVQQVKFAQKKGLSFHESGSPGTMIDDLIGLLGETQERRLSKGYERYSYLYMPHIRKEILYRLFENKVGRLFFVRTGDKIVSISFIAAYNHKSYALLIGSTKQAYALRAPTFNWFNMIKKLKDEGFDYLNLGGVPEDSSKDKMVFAKTSYGAEKTMCAGVKTPHLNGSFFNLMNIIYTKLPDAKIKKTIAKVLSGRRG